MSSHIEEFRAHARRHGFSLNNRFLVTIPLPTKVMKRLSSGEKEESDLQRFFKTGVRVVNAFANGMGDDKRGLQVMCSSTEIPGVNLERSISRNNGFNQQVATGISEEDISFRFMLSADCEEKRILDFWMAEIFDYKRRKVGYYRDYVSDITIETLDFHDEKRFGIKLVEAYPVLFNKLTLDKQQNTEFNVYDTNFTFKRQEPLWGEYEKTLFGNLTPVKLGKSIMSGDPVAVAQEARKLKMAAANGTLTSQLGGEVYASMSRVVDDLAGVSASEADGMISMFKGNTIANMPGDNPDKSTLMDLADNLLP